MNRARRSNVAINKPFVSGGTYNPNATPKPLIQPAVSAANASVPVASKPVEQVKKLQDISATQLPMPIQVKDEPMVHDNVTEQVDESLSLDITNEENGTTGKIPFKKIFQKRKKSSERTRDKKQRQNRQLRKSMLPKNALMALNEVKGINISDFTINSNTDGGFTAIVTVNSNQYEGKGQSKMAAKNVACEKALRDYIIAKMTPRPKKHKPQPEPVPAAPPVVAVNEDEPMDTSENDGTEPVEDELPMLNLASFAIYKLFAEWEREGFVVPEMHPSANSAAQQQADPNASTSTTPVVPKEPKKPPVRTELPANWETMHPATLLCIMRPGITYTDHGCSGEKPNVLQRFGVIVDDQEFSANGRSKKIARRNVAVNVCNTLFGTKFAYEEH